jgi:predicted PurR-regulated permease PerM
MRSERLAKISNIPIWLGLVLLALTAAYLYAIHAILSPILIGIVLIFVLTGINDPFARRVSTAVGLLLFIWVFIRAQVIFFPFIAAYILAYLLDPVADFLEKKRWHRGWASVMLILLFMMCLASIGAVLVPALVHQIQNFVNALPQVMNSIQSDILEKVPNVFKYFGIEESEFRENWANTVPKGLQQAFNNLLKGVLSITSFLGQILNIILIPVIAFYLLKDFNSFRNTFLSFFSKKIRPRISSYLYRVDRIVGGYLRAQILVSLFVGAATVLGLAVCRIPFAILLGVMAGILNFIPIIGLYVGLAITAMVAFLDPNPLWVLLKVLIVYGVVQGLEGAVIQPKIVGDRVGMHPVLVMFSVLFFSKFFGFWGLIIGVPTAAVVMFFIDEYKRKNTMMHMVEEKGTARQ